MLLRAPKLNHRILGSKNRAIGLGLSGKVKGLREWMRKAGSEGLETSLGFGVSDCGVRVWNVAHGERTTAGGSTGLQGEREVVVQL